MVVCGGCDSWKCLDSVEAFRPRTGAWQYLAPLKTARRGCAVVVVKGSSEVCFIFHAFSPCNNEG